MRKQAERHEGDGGTFCGAFTITAGSQTINSGIARIGNPLGSGAAIISVLKANNDASSEATPQGLSSTDLP